MKLQTAASYCDMSTAYFMKQVDAGLFPKPVFEEGRTKRFDKCEIDRAIDLLSHPTNRPVIGDRRI